MEAIYVRQSLDKKDSLSIEGQIALCRRYAGEEARVFQDRGYSGKNTNRPSFSALMEAVEAGEVHKILVYRLDRFSRSLADFSRIWETLERHGVQFQSVTEQFDTSSPMGRAMLNIVMTFAQLERETTAQRVRDSYRHRLALGAWPGGPPPYGFALTRERDGAGRLVSRLAPNEKAEIVQDIFRRYAQDDVSLRGLAQGLTHRGVHGPKREGWDSGTLSRLLRSPLYVRATEEVYWHYLSRGVPALQPPESFDGSHACNLIGRRGRDGGEEPLLSLAGHRGIVEASLWLRVQEKLAENRQLDRTRAGKYSWLTGLLKCGRCGYAVRINRSGGGFHLLCSGRSNLSRCDASIRLQLRELETAVGQALKDVLDQCAREAPPAGADGTDRELLEVEERILRLVQALEESSQVSAAYISEEIDRLHSRREALRQRGERESGGQRRSEGLDFDRAPLWEKKRIAAEFIQRILLDGEEATVVWSA